eukprot:9154795-Pyramimonas_sp.AAC.1
MNFIAASEVTPLFGWNLSGSVVQYMRGTNIQNAGYQRCEHPGFPGACSVCNVLVPWANPSQSLRGQRGVRGDLSVKSRRP